MSMPLIGGKLTLPFRLPFVASVLAVFVMGVASGCAVRTPVVSRPPSACAGQGTVLILIHSPDGFAAEELVERARARDVLRGRELAGRVSFRVLSPNLSVATIGAAKREAEERGASLMLFQSERGGWAATVADSGTNSPFQFPVPSAILFLDGEVEPFLIPFSHYALGCVSEALKDFLELEAWGRKVLGAGVWHFWVGATLTRLGESHQALSHFDQAARLLSPADGGIYGELQLARGQLLAQRAVFEPRFANDALAALSSAVDHLQAWDERAAAAAHIALGNYWVRVAAPESPQLLEKAKGHLLAAESRLILPRDEAVWASLQHSVAAAQVLLSVQSSAPVPLLEDALERLGKAKKVWLRRGDEGRAEAASWQIRDALERLIGAL